MKLLKIAAMAVFGLAATSAYAFHSGGVAECEGCHTMHNSLDGEAMFTALPQFESGPYLLQGTDQSSACLNCHQHAGDTGPSSYHVSTADVDMPAGVAPIQRTPGGDFGWLKKSYTFVVRGSTLTNHGERHGHNVVAADYGYVADGVQTVAPGGAYPAASLHCSSCHDPHGKYRRLVDGSIVDGTTTSLPIKNSGSYHSSADPTSWGAVGVYRILGGIGYQPKSTPGFAFGNTVPAAVSPATYNRTEAVSQTRVAYGSSMSEWCANCHGSMLQQSYTSGMAGLVHPAGNGAVLGSAIATNYNAYVKSGDLSGTVATSFSSLAPYEEGVGATYADLKAHAAPTYTDATGAQATSQVSCLSCHRAHASAFESMIRFGHANEFMMTADTAGVPLYPDVATAAAPSQGLTAAESAAAYYDRPATTFAPYQRLLCNKCHAKD